MNNFIKILNASKRFVFDSNYRFLLCATYGLYNRLDDKQYLERVFKANLGYDLDLENPKSFNEKLQWLKLYDRQPIYTTMVDKYAAKEYVANIIGSEYIIPTLGVWERPEEIDWDILPDQFVLKVTHDSGGLVICKDKSKLDKNAAIKKLKKSLKRDYYKQNREWPYKNVPRRIIAEKYMEDNGDADLIDYKFMCFNSKVKCTLIATNRFSGDGLHITFYDTNWSKMPFERKRHSVDKEEIQKPKTYEQMVEFAEKLSEHIPFARIDFYEIKGKPYFGEITFFPASGFEEFKPESWDDELGNWIVLPNRGGY